MGYFYVSTDKEDNRSTTNEAARGKFCVMMFDVNYNAYFWFTDDVTDAGLKFKGVNADATKGKNLEILLNKDNYASKTRAFGFISSEGDGYKGYSYTMKLTDVPVIDPAP